MTRDRHASRRGISMILVVVIVLLSIVLASVAVLKYVKLQHVQRVQKELLEMRKVEDERITALRSEVSGQLVATGLFGSETLDQLSASGLPRKELRTRGETVLAPQPEKAAHYSPENRPRIEDKDRQLAKLAQDYGIYPTLQQLVQVAAARLTYVRHVNEELKLQLQIAKTHTQSVSVLKDPVTRRSGEYKAHLTNLISEVNRKIKEEEDAFNARMQDLRTSLEAAKAATEQEDANFYAWKIKNKNDRTRLQDELERLKVQEAIKYEVSTAHGHVLRPDVFNGIAFLDIGSRDRVVPGLIFVAGKRGEQDRVIEKAELKVKKVWPTYSEVLITKVLNNDAPLVEGDLIFNPIFNTRRPLVVVFDGKEQPLIIRPTWDIKEATRRMIELGGEVRDEVTLDIDFLIFTETEAGKQITAYRKYKTAVELGIPYLKASEIYQFLGE